MCILLFVAIEGHLPFLVLGLFHWMRYLEVFLVLQDEQSGVVDELVGEFEVCLGRNENGLAAAHLDSIINNANASWLYINY